MIGGGGQPKQKISNIQCWMIFWLGLFAHMQKNIEFSIEFFTEQLAKYSKIMLKVFNLFGTMVLKSLINKLHSFRHEMYHCFTFFQPIFRAKYLGMQPFLVWHRGGLACRTSFRRRARRCTKEVKMTESDGGE